MIIIRPGRASAQPVSVRPRRAERGAASSSSTSRHTLRRVAGLPVPAPFDPRAVGHSRRIEALNPPKAHYLRWCAVRIRQASIATTPAQLLSGRAGVRLRPRGAGRTARKFLNGYWQSPRYFADVEATPAEELRIPHEFRFAAAAAELAEEMNRANAVSLHVRRGDYVAIHRR